MTIRPAARRAGILALAAAVSGCAGMGGAGGGLAGGMIPGAPVAAGNGRVSYTCPGGTYFDTAYDPATTTMRLRVDGATSHPHTLDRLVGPTGQTSYQDAEYQLIPGTGTSQVTLVPRAPAGAPMVCSAVP